MLNHYRSQHLCHVNFEKCGNENLHIPNIDSEITGCRQSRQKYLQVIWWKRPFIWLFGSIDILYHQIYRGVQNCTIHNTHGPLTRYVKLRVGHAPGIQETFSPPLWVSDPDMHHGTCVTQGPWCMLGLLTSMRNPQFYVSGKRPMAMRSNMHEHPLSEHKVSFFKTSLLVDRSIFTKIMCHVHDVPVCLPLSSE